MKEFWRAVLVALLLGAAVALGAYLTAPGKQVVPPPVIPLEGKVPPAITQVAPEATPVCGIVACDVP